MAVTFLLKKETVVIRVTASVNSNVFVDRARVIGLFDWKIFGYWKAETFIGNLRLRSSARKRLWNLTEKM